MRTKRARRGAVLLVALILSTAVLLTVAPSTQAAEMLNGGAHARVNFVDPAGGGPVPSAPAAAASAAGWIVGGLAALALVLVAAALIGRAGWAAGPRDAALQRRLVALPVKIDNPSCQSAPEGCRKVA